MKKEQLKKDFVESFKFGFGFYIGFTTARLIKRTIKALM